VVGRSGGRAILRRGSIHKEKARTESESESESDRNIAVLFALSLPTYAYWAASL